MFASCLCAFVVAFIYALTQLIGKGEEGDGDELEVLPGKGNADNGQAKQNAADGIAQGDD